MDDERQFELKFDAEDGSSPEEDVPQRRTVTKSKGIQRRYSGAFFPKAKDFIVAGGKFQSVINIHQAVASAPPGKQAALIRAMSMESYPQRIDFTVIPLGHINLLHPIGLHGASGVANRKYGRNSVRRMYSAHIHDYKSTLAVALYQGEGAEDVCKGFRVRVSRSLPLQRWREDFSRYSKLR
jgi:hypothetical protein